MPTLYIARHGNTFEAGETPRRIGRGTDLPLVASGRAQAAALGECFTAQKIAFDKIFSAPLKRTRETADAIAAAWENITDQIGRDQQIALYKASLGM